MAVSRTVHLDDLTPNELAILVNDLAGTDLAHFFNELGWHLGDHRIEAVRESLDSDAVLLGAALVRTPTKDTPQ